MLVQRLLFRLDQTSEQVGKDPFAEVHCGVSESTNQLMLRRKGLTSGIIPRSLHTLDHQIINIDLCIKHPPFLQMNHQAPNLRINLTPGNDHCLSLYPLFDHFQHFIRMLPHRRLGSNIPLEIKSICNVRTGEFTHADPPNDIPHCYFAFSVDGNNMLAIVEH
jgi:hypothetical protein